MDAASKGRTYFVIKRVPILLTVSDGSAEVIWNQDVLEMTIEIIINIQNAKTPPTPC
jgi:hypothetical protein